MNTNTQAGSESSSSETPSTTHHFVGRERLIKDFWNMIRVQNVINVEEEQMLRLSLC